jgi:poly(A) polymerase Pap1
MPFMTLRENKNTHSALRKEAWTSAIFNNNKKKKKRFKVLKRSENMRSQEGIQTSKKNRNSQIGINQHSGGRLYNSVMARRWQ